MKVIFEKYTIKNSILKKFTGFATEITVPEGVTKIRSFVFGCRTKLTQITIPESVIDIGSGAFSECTRLTQINIPQGITEIARCTFQDCISLTQINIPEGVTEIGGGAFFSCISLTQINIPQSVTEIGGGTFWGCTSLTQINIPQGVNEIRRHAFYRCRNLTQISIPEGVTKIGKEAFEKCSSLTQINIPQGLTEMGEDVFQDCANLQRILVSNNNEVVRLKSYLADELKDKVTSYYLQHQQNLSKIRRCQLALCARSFNLFRSSLNNDVTGLIYQFLSFEDIITLSFICTGLKPIKLIAQSIQSVHYRGPILRIKPKQAVTTLFLRQYTPTNENDKEFAGYHRSLNQYNMNLKNSISQSLSKSKSNNSNRANNNGGMQCQLL